MHSLEECKPLDDNVHCLHNTTHWSLNRVQKKQMNSPKEITFKGAKALGVGNSLDHLGEEWNTLFANRWAITGKHHKTKIMHFMGLWDGPTWPILPSHFLSLFIVCYISFFKQSMLSYCFGLMDNICLFKDINTLLLLLVLLKLHSVHSHQKLLSSFSRGLFKWPRGNYPNRRMHRWITHPWWVIWVGGILVQSSSLTHNCFLVKWFCKFTPIMLQP